MKYKVKTKGGSVPGELRKSEEKLKDLLDVVPVLKKYKMDQELMKQVKALRANRKTVSLTVEVSREFNGKPLTAKAEIRGPYNKLSIMKQLKSEIRKQIQEERIKARPPIEDYRFPQGVVVKKLAEVYLEPNSFVKVLHRKIRQDIMGRTKKPGTGDNYIGVEIEFASKKDREFIADRLCEAGLGKYVCIKDDGSIGSGTRLRESYPHAHEVCILVRQSEYATVIPKVCAVLAACEVKVDKTCGLHVHIDMRNRDVKKCFANFVSTQHFLYAMLPANRKNSRYAYPIKGRHWRVADERYHGINTHAFDKYRTLEIRMHSGTTDGAKINNWVALLLGIADAQDIQRAPSTVRGLKRVTGITEELTTYIENRIAKFADQHQKVPLESHYQDCMPDLPVPTDLHFEETMSIEESEAA